MTFIDTIVVPQGAEYQAVCRGLKKVRAKNVRVVSIPIGTKNIERTLANYSIELNNAQNILIVGLAGSLSQLYSVGDAVLYQSCWNLNRQHINIESELTTAIGKKLSINLVEGLSCDRVIHQATDKLKLSQTYPVSVVDMEGYGYIKQLQQRNITVAMLRIISDDLTGDIPDLTNAIDGNGNLKAIPMAIAFLKQPLPAIRLIQGSLIGLNTLQKVISKLLTPVRARRVPQGYRSA